jgi:hypothetical protein
MAETKSIPDTPTHSHHSEASRADMESPLHKAAGLAGVISRYASGDGSTPIQDSAIYGALGLLAKVLNEVRQASADRRDLPVGWSDELASALGVCEVLRGQFLLPEHSTSGMHEGGSEFFTTSNAIWALADQIEYLRTLMLYPHEIATSGAGVQSPVHQRH